MAVRAQAHCANDVYTFPHVMTTMCAQGCGTTMTMLTQHHTMTTWPLNPCVRATWALSPSWQQCRHTAYVVIAEHKGSTEPLHGDDMDTEPVCEGEDKNRMQLPTQQ